MNKIEVDNRVQTIIENVRAGRAVEDDSGIELKKEWPEPTKSARQLAGAANSLRADTLLYVIGVDEKSGEIISPQKYEPASWYGQVTKQFDQIAPELLRSQTVFVGDGSESVTVLVFNTSEFPYVINIDSHKREVPMRVGAGTQSAHRSQLVRLLDPTMRVPRMFITEAAVAATWTDKPARDEVTDAPAHQRIESVEISIRASIFIEHLGGGPITLPVRQMRARFVCGRFESRPKVQVEPLGRNTLPYVMPLSSPPPPAPVPPQYGVYALNDHVIATAPGEFKVQVYDDVQWGADTQRAVPSHDNSSLDFLLSVVGVSSLVRLTAPLVRTAGPSIAHTAGGPNGDSHVQQLGEWEFRPDEADPWGGD